MSMKIEHRPAREPAVTCERLEDRTFLSAAFNFQRTYVLDATKNGGEFHLNLQERGIQGPTKIILRATNGLTHVDFVGTNKRDVLEIRFDGGTIGKSAEGMPSRLTLCPGDDDVLIRNQPPVDPDIFVSLGDGNDRFENRGRLLNIFASGGSGNDTLIGGPGNDFLIGDAGKDYIKGNAGNDTLIGGDHNDKLFGDAGRDVLNGNAGNDYLDGGNHSDNLAGGLGWDTIRGGSGNDVLHGNEPGATNETGTLVGDRVGDVLDGGTGTDTVFRENLDKVFFSETKIRVW